MKEMIIDAFAGGGGASVGIEMALGRQVDVAVNHDPDAILMHKTNHPSTVHTNPGDLVLDSAAGSCTTAVAAINTGRNYICFEKDKEFYEIGCKRV